MIKNRLTERWDGFLLLIKAFPHGEGGSCVPRKHETDEGVIFSIQPVPPPLHQSGSHGGY